MKVKELIELLNNLSDEDKELEIAVASPVLMNATILSISHCDNSDCNEEFLKNMGIPKKLIHIDHIGM